MRRNVILITVIAALLGVLLVTLTAKRGPTLDLLITADLVFDGDRFQSDSAVAIEGDHVVEVGKTSSLLDRRYERVLTFDEATILPGFIDLHVHLSVAWADEVLRSGVTTVRDLGSGAPITPLGVGQQGELRYYKAGPIITVAGGYPIPVWGRGIAEVVNGRADARRAVNRLARQGADVIKVALEPGRHDQWPMLTVPELRAIYRAAHDASPPLQVTAHVTERRGVLRALEGRVDEWAHMPCRWVGNGPLLRMAESGRPIVGTLHVMKALGCPGVMRNARTFVSYGGLLLFGTDMGNPGVPTALDVQEFRLMERAGMFPQDLIEAATSRAAARLLNAPPLLGYLREDAPADVLVVGGDPFENLRALKDVLLVMVGGEIVLEQ